MAGNPFTYLPVDVCGDIALPDFPVVQDCVSYSQRKSEIGGLLIRPPGALSPMVWYDFDEWASFIDNEDPAATHHLAGRGSWLQTAKEEANLAGGRVIENRARTQTIVFSVSNLNTGHVDFCRDLQRNKKDFTFWLRTVDNRVIGDHSGISPVFVDADFTFQQGINARESITITIDAEFLNLPNLL
jgi:hypothetical protein